MPIGLYIGLHYSVKLSQLDIKGNPRPPSYYGD